VSSTATSYMLPAALIGRADLSRLVREVESVDADLESQKVRTHADKSGYRMPTMSRSLSDFVDLNKIDLADDKRRMELTENLRVLKDKAPIMHMTFAVDADPEFLQQLVTWIRTEVHPHALLSVGLQPSIVGGVYVRTPNHVHDYSIKTLLSGKRDIIVHELEGLV
jgi:hypothetical protein